MISIYPITSPLHDESSVAGVTAEFLSSLAIGYEWKENFDDWGQGGLDLVYVRTGGTEGVFKPLLPRLRQSRVPIYLLTSGKSNSLAASMEILSYMRRNGIAGEIIHGSPEYVSSRIAELERIETARKRLFGMRLGVVGRPSDWLISSAADYYVVRKRAGIELVDIPVEELVERARAVVEDAADVRRVCGEALEGAPENIVSAAPGAYRIYRALKDIVAEYRLDGLSLRCFDLLDSLHNTGCLALSLLNSEGVVCSCEGDVPALLTMCVANALVGVSGFQANPSRIDPETGEVLFAHCTIPLNMVEKYSFDTHFESGIGVGICGRLEAGPVTVAKVSGNFDRCFAEDAEILRSQSQADLCRTQVVLKMDDTSYFLKNPIGNHHIIIPGHIAGLIRELCGSL